MLVLVLVLRFSVLYELRVRSERTDVAVCRISLCYVWILAVLVFKALHVARHHLIGQRIPIRCHYWPPSAPGDRRQSTYMFDRTDKLVLAIVPLSVRDFGTILPVYQPTSATAESNPWTIRRALTMHLFVLVVAWLSVSRLTLVFFFGAGYKYPYILTFLMTVITVNGYGNWSPSR